MHEAMRQLLLHQNRRLSHCRPRRNLTVDPRKVVPSPDVAHIDVQRNCRLESRLETVAKARTVEARLVSCAEQSFDDICDRLVSDGGELGRRLTLEKLEGGREELAARSKRSVSRLRDFIVSGRRLAEK